MTVAANIHTAMTLDSTAANLIVEATEVVRVVRTIGGTQAEGAVVITYVPLDLVHSINWFPNQRILITRITGCNGLTAMAATVNTTAWDIDTEDGAGTKVKDVAALAVGVYAVDAKIAALTLATTNADLIVEASEIVKMLVTQVGLQGEGTISIWYKDLAVRDVPGDWPPLPTA